MQKLSVKLSLRRAVVLIVVLILAAMLLVPAHDAVNRWLARTLAINLQDRLIDVSMQILDGQAPDLSAYDRISSYEIWQPEAIVAYHTSAFGIVPSSSYYGFYYSVDGKMHPCPGMENYDRTDTDSGVRYQQPDGDNYCEIEPISDNFYYFKLGF